MLEDKPDPVDITQAEARNQILPRSPLLSSRGIGWESILVEYGYQPAFETPEVCHQQYLISIHLGNPIRLRQVVGGQAQTVWVRSGDVFLAPPGFSRQYRWDREMEYIALFLEPNLLTRAARELAGSEQVEILPLFKQTDRLIEGIGLALKLELETERTGNRLYINTLASTLAMHLLWHYGAELMVPEGSEEASRLRLQRAIAYIQEHLTEELSIEVLSDGVGISPFHFARMFKQLTGLSPHQYVNQCRIDRAKQLLLRHDLKIREVAAQVGFTDPSHFSKLFRQLTGVSPKAFRQH